MITCSRCSIEKEPTEFYSSKSKVCKDCAKERQRLYHQRTRAKRLQSQKKYYEENKEYFSSRNKKYREHNKEKIQDYNKEYSKKHYLENKHVYMDRCARRRANKLQATPDWLSGSQRAHIRRTYKLREFISEVTGEEYHVDHIEPLQGENICGLHVPWNLRVIPAKDNLSKGNRTPS